MVKLKLQLAIIVMQLIYTLLALMFVDFSFGLSYKNRRGCFTLSV